MADFDQAIKLKPDHVSALVGRAGMQLAANDTAGAKRDLDAADGFAAKESDIRLQMGHMYSRADLLDSAIAQFDLWISARHEDAQLVDALNGRCWARALQGRDLAQALSDCNSAFRLASGVSSLSAHVLNGRGLTYLRLGQYDRSIADYDAALKLSPMVASSRYGRGVAKMRQKRNADGQADIDAAMALSPNVAGEFNEHGIVP